MTSARPSLPARFGYIPGLDGLRFVAVAIVIAAHYRILPHIPGGFGVSIFFFISGFLISRLMLAEEKALGRMALGRFYIRRFIRLVPPLMLMGSVAVPSLWLVDPSRFSLAQIILSFSYFGNIHKIGARIFGWNPGYDALEPLWSLAVEEHFYLTIPPILMLIRGNANRIRLVGAILAGTLALRLMIWWTVPHLADDINYNFTLTRIDAISWGILLTLLLDAGRVPSHWIERRAYRLLWGGMGAMLLSLVHWSPAYEAAIKYTPQSLAIGIAFCGAIFPARTAWLRRVAEWPVIRYPGKISYELYLWHFPVYALASAVIPVPRLVAAISLAITLAVSALAYAVTTRQLAPVRQKFGGHPH